MSEDKINSPDPYEEALRKMESGEEWSITDVVISLVKKVRGLEKTVAEHKERIEVLEEYIDHQDTLDAERRERE